MRKIKLITVLFLVVLSIKVAAQIPNSGFENWTGNEPTGWDNLNSLTSITGIYTCTKGTPGNPGASYIKLVTKTIPIIGLVPGITLSGKLDKTNFIPKSGFPYSQRPLALTGNWQYLPSGNDQGFIGIAFTKWNTVNNKRDTISTTYHLLTGSVTNWESFYIPISFNDPSNPDTCLIILSASSITSPVANSYLYTDNLDFSFVSSVNEKIKSSASIKIFPNPVTEILQFKLTESSNHSSYSYKIINSLGQIVQSSDNQLNYSICISNLAEGFYELFIDTEKNQYINKFIKQ